MYHIAAFLQAITLCAPELHFPYYPRTDRIVQLNCYIDMYMYSLVIFNDIQDLSHTAQLRDAAIK